MEKKQKQHLDSHGNADGEVLQKGLVITRFAKEALIEDIEGKHIRCSIKPGLDSLVCGDRVLWIPEKETHGLVVSIFPRTAFLERTHPYYGKKPVAANITQLVITIAPKPEITWSLLDSYLVMAECLDLKAIIVLNKTDIPCEAIKDTLSEVYQPLGYRLIYTEKENQTGYSELKKALENEVSIFTGQSGVGKSSLIAGILPHETLSTASISVQSELGRHTTSNSRYYHLEGGGGLIDSPGVRTFSLKDMHLTDITQGYREFREQVTLCKFRNCNHENTPGCAVIEAVENGLISRFRYDHFLALRNTS